MIAPGKTLLTSLPDKLMVCRFLRRERQGRILVQVTEARGKLGLRTK